MKPAKFGYARPARLDEALALLAAGVAAGQDVKCLAGGQTLVPVLNLRFAQVDGVVDLSAISSLSFIRRDKDALVIGAMTRHAEIETSAEVARAHPLLVVAAREIAHMTIRNRGTIGGSLIHADPAAEWPLCAVALDAQLTLRSARATRMVPARTFFLGPLSTVVRPDEILTEIRFPLPRRRTTFGFEEFARRAGAFAIAAVACELEWQDGVVAAASIALGGVHGTPLHVPAAGALLLGRKPDEAAIRTAAAAAASACDPVSDVHGSAAYRRRLVEVLTVRALRQAGAEQPAPVAGGARGVRKARATGDNDLRDRRKISLRINGREVEGEVPVRRLLADYLRQDLGLTATRIGCEHGVCGACTVLIDGESVRSCLTFAVQADGAAITTVEGLADGDKMHPLQQAFWDHHALQCGFCTSGFLLSACDFLKQTPHPSADEVRHALSGNLCRCTGYANIVKAVLAVAEEPGS